MPTSDCLFLEKIFLNVREYGKFTSYWKFIACIWVDLVWTFWETKPQHKWWEKQDVEHEFFYNIINNEIDS